MAERVFRCAVCTGKSTEDGLEEEFNTTTSMGRLTVNMLLSFAQFEREDTGERIRDKIAASKRRGMWMGGPEPLGYDVLDRKLAPNQQEAETVRHIMCCYLALGSVDELVDELAREGYRTKMQKRVRRPHKGGSAFRRGTLFHMLSIRIYRGMIIHKEKYIEGEHVAIVPEELWDDVQATMAKRAQGPSRRLKARHPSLLVGNLVDGEGRAMTTSHTTKRGVATATTSPGPTCSTVRPDGGSRRTISSSWSATASPSC